MPKSIIVLIGGGYSSGKRTAATMLKDKLLKSGNTTKTNVELVDLENFKWNQGSQGVRKDAIQESDEQSKGGDSDNKTHKPSRYNFTSLRNYLAQKSTGQTDGIQQILLVHGLYALYDKELREMSHIKVFVACDNDTGLIRSITRDVLTKAQKTLSEVLNEYINGAKSEMSEYIFPTKEFSDIILPGGAEGNAADLLVNGIVPYLAQRDNQENMVQLVESYLRPKPNDILKDRFDADKGKFYEVT